METNSIKRGVRLPKKTKRNVEHSHSGRIIVYGHNTNDKEFLRGNNGLLQKAQHIFAKKA